MKKIISIFSLILCFVITMFSLVGCNNDSTKGTVVEKNVSEKVDKLEFLLCWLPNDLTQEDFNVAKECGFETVLMNVYQAGYFNTPLYEQITGYIRNAGMKYQPHLENAGLSDVHASPDEQHLYDQNVKDKMARDNVDTIVMFDEPAMRYYDEIASWIPQFERNYPNMTFFVNLFPDYAGGSALGGSYKEYVENFAEKVLKKLSGEKWLSVDYYPYLFSDVTNTNDGIYSTWLYDLETMRYAVKDIQNAHLHFDIMTCGMYSDQIAWRNPTMEELRQQVYVALCYGVERFGCYTYGKPLGNTFHPKDKLTMIDPDNGNPDDHYKTYIWYDVQKLIREISGYHGNGINIEGLSNTYLQYEYEGTKCFAGSESSKVIFDKKNKSNINANFQNLEHQLSSLSEINSVYSSQDTIFAQFHNKDGKKAYVVCNFADPAYNVSDNIIIDFKNTKKVTVINKGISKSYDINKGNFEYQLEPGDGCMIVLD